MRIKVVWVGKTKNPQLASVCDDFIGRIRHLVGLRIVQTKDVKVRDEQKRTEIENQRLAAVLDRTDFVIGLDPKGRTYSSRGFASLLERHMVRNPRDLVFVLGGPTGLSDVVRERSDVLCSLSALTFSHDLARAVLLEQIYRALATIRNLPYPK